MVSFSESNKLASHVQEGHERTHPKIRHSSETENVRRLVLRLRSAPVGAYTFSIDGQK